MALDELVDTARISTSRRTIVRTGVKMAYAAPIVAATMKLSAQSGFAASIGPNECSKGGVCADAATCGGTVSTCACFFTREGNTRCFVGEFSCGQFPECPPDGGACPSGSACAATCCGQSCVPLCADAGAGDFVPGHGSSL
jgi:hypothetical protein